MNEFTRSQHERGHELGQCRHEISDKSKQKKQKEPSHTHKSHEHETVSNKKRNALKYLKTQTG